MFSKKPNLARLAFRLGAVPGLAPAFANARLRWFFLLRRMLPYDTQVAISSVLDQVMSDTTIKQVLFYVTHDSGIELDFELDPQNSGVPTTKDMPSTAAPGTLVKTCIMLLRCYYDEQLPDAPTEPDPPVANNPESPPPIIA
jgi:hypothetical protein